METAQNCDTFIILAIKAQIGQIERHKLENFSLENSISSVKQYAMQRSNHLQSCGPLELIHRGNVLTSEARLCDIGITTGDVIYVLRKPVPPAVQPPPSFTDAELLQIVASLRGFGCTPSAPGWTRAMQELNNDETMEKIMKHVPSLVDDHISISILHEIELLAALGANLNTMRKGATSRPAIPAALKILAKIVGKSSEVATPAPSTSEEATPVSGYAYSLEALSEDEDADDEADEGEEEGAPNAITREHLAVALEMASSNAGGSSASENLLRALRAGLQRTSAANTQNANGQSAAATAAASRAIITPDMFSNALSQVVGSNLPSVATTSSNATQPGAEGWSGASSSGSNSFTTQLHHMHEMGLLDDRVNIRALLVSGGDVNAAINLVFSGAIDD